MTAHMADWQSTRHGAGRTDWPAPPSAARDAVVDEVVPRIALGHDRYGGPLDVDQPAQRAVLDDQAAGVEPVRRPRLELVRRTDDDPGALRWTSCDRCTRPAFRTLGSRALCEEHRAEITGPILDRIIADEGRPGWGVPQRRRTDLAPRAYELRCVQCGAGWVDRAGAVCPWCSDRVAAVTR